MGLRRKHSLIRCFFLSFLGCCQYDKKEEKDDRNEINLISRSRRTCWFSLGIKAFLKTNDIFYMRYDMALFCAYGSTNAVYLGIRNKTDKDQ